MQEAVDSNPDRPSGSLQDDPTKRTFELVTSGEDGRITVLESRHLKEASSGKERMSIEKLEEISVSGNGFAKDLARQFHESQTEKDRSRVLANAERICGDTVQKNDKTARLTDTQTLKALTEDASVPSERRDLAVNLQDMRNKAKYLGLDTTLIDDEADNALKPELGKYKKVWEATGDEREITATEVGKHYHFQLGATESHVKEADPLAQFAQLSLDQQISILSLASNTFTNSVNQQSYEIAIKTASGVGEGAKTLADEALLLVKGIGFVGKFGLDIATNNPEYLKEADQVGQTIGTLLVGGIRIWSISEAYLEEIGASSDYAKPFKDALWLGNELDKRWAAKSPAEKAEIGAKLETEILGNLLIPFGAGKLAKSEKLTAFLEELATGTKALGGGAKEKVGKLVTELLDEVFCESAITPDGQRIRIPKTTERTTSLKSEIFKEEPSGNAAGKERPLSASESNAEKTSKKSSAERDTPEKTEKLSRKEIDELIEKAYQNLPQKLKDFLIEKKIEIKYVDDVASEFSDRSDLKNALGAYDWGSNKIYISRFVKGQTNFDIDFALRHEIGHALNYKTLEKPGLEYFKPIRLSDKQKDFIDVFNKDLENINKTDPTILKKLGFDISTPEGEAFARDEIFADMFAHSTGCDTKNYRSILMAEKFKKSLEFMRGRSNV
ncbi:MAG: hypothetical protein IAF58_03785 [Leptolyngbya sp.]|nr:hypothetical protein [Candidatus Melainabacteria bacterium]